MHAAQIIATHPDVKGQTNDILIKCLEECYACAQTCTVCADACIAEEMVAQLRQCIRLNLDCADLCLAAGSLASRRAGGNEQVLVAALEACGIACTACADECERHAEMHEHCRICAEPCRRCAEACDQAISPIRQWWSTGGSPRAAPLAIGDAEG